MIRRHLGVVPSFRQRNYRPIALLGFTSLVAVDADAEVEAAVFPGVGAHPGAKREIPLAP